MRFVQAHDISGLRVGIGVCPCGAWCKFRYSALFARQFVGNKSFIHAPRVVSATFLLDPDIISVLQLLFLDFINARCTPSF